MVQGGALRTAPDGVLPGQVRQMVLDACGPLGIPLSLSAPRLEEAAEWDEAFLTGTGRLIRPVKQVRVPEGMQGGGTCRRREAMLDTGEQASWSRQVSR